MKVKPPEFFPALSVPFILLGISEFVCCVSISSSFLMIHLESQHFQYLVI